MTVRLNHAKMAELVSMESTRTVVLACPVGVAASVSNGWTLVKFRLPVPTAQSVDQPTWTTITVHVDPVGSGKSVTNEKVSFYMGFRLTASFLD